MSVDRWLALHPAENADPGRRRSLNCRRQAWEITEAQCEEFGEAQLAHRIRQYLPEQGQLFVGNSLVVRLIDA